MHKYGSVVGRKGKDGVRASQEAYHASGATTNPFLLRVSYKHRSILRISAGNRLALGAGRRGRSEVALPSLRVLGEDGEPSPGAGGRRGGARVQYCSSKLWLWIIEL